MLNTPQQRTFAQIAEELADDEHSFPSGILPHPQFDAAMRTFHLLYSSYRMFLVVGPSGVGKDALAMSILSALNRPILDSPDLLRAVMVTAASAQGRAFSMLELWKDTLYAMNEPLVGRKHDLDGERRHTQEAPDLGLTPTQKQAKSAYDLRRYVCRAAKDRQLKLLLIDEAFAIVKTERDRSLLEQLDALRNLADAAPFRIALVSTGRILEKFESSGELARRMRVMHFPRYGSPLGTNGRPVAHSDPVADRKAHLGVFVRLQNELPESSRLKPTPHQLEDLYSLSLGCVGHLVDWCRRAIIHCHHSGRDQLRWRDFTETPLSKATLDKLRKQSDDSESKLQALCQPPAFSKPDPPPDDDPTPPVGPSPKKPRSRRKGVPHATRYGKLREAKRNGDT